MGAQEVGEEAKRHNIRQIQKYFETAPSFIGPGPPPDEPRGRKHKGASRVPATDSAHDFWFSESNRDAARILEPLIREIRQGRQAWRGIYFSLVLTHLYEDPTSVARWENKLTKYDRLMYAAYKKMCALIADAIYAEYGERQIMVEIPKRAERVKSKMEARDTDRAEVQAAVHRARYERFRQVEKVLDKGREAAKIEFSRREGLSVPTVERCIRFVEKGHEVA